jgi:general secretion pathway protein H
MQRQRGLTLLELLVVLAIIGFSVAGVSLSLRDSSQTQLEREAQRLVAILEAARAQSRTSGVALVWQASPEGFVIQSNNKSLAARPETWLAAGTQATLSTTTGNMVVLGPEPILAPIRITLSAATTNTSTASLNIGTDGLQPFRVMP